MKVNPTQMTWQAPTQNVDGTPIDYVLNYEVGLEDANGQLQPSMVIPGQLQDGGDYTAPIADLGLAAGSTYRIALRTFAKDEPARKSVYSEMVDFAISDRIPNPPLAFAVS
jgi:hypothetical protein